MAGLDYCNSAYNCCIERILVRKMSDNLIPKKEDGITVATPIVTEEERAIIPQYYFQISQTHVSVNAAELPFELRFRAIERFDDGGYMFGETQRKQALASHLEDLVAARTVVETVIQAAEPQIHAHLSSTETANAGLGLLSQLVSAYNAVHTPQETMAFIETWRTRYSRQFSSTEAGQGLMRRWIELAITPLSSADMISIDMDANPTRILGREEKPGLYINAVQYVEAVLYAHKTHVNMPSSFYEDAKRVIEHGMNVIAGFIIDKTGDRGLSEQYHNYCTILFADLQKSVTQNRATIRSQNVTEDDLRAYLLAYETMSAAYYQLNPQWGRCLSDSSPKQDPTAKEGLEMTYETIENVKVVTITNYNDLKFYVDPEATKLTKKYTPRVVLYSREIFGECHYSCDSRLGKSFPESDQDLEIAVAHLIEFSQIMGEFGGVTESGYHAVVELMNTSRATKQITLTRELIENAVAKGYVRQETVGAETVYYPTEKATKPLCNTRAQDAALNMNRAFMYHTGVSMGDTGHVRLELAWAAD